MPLVKHPKQVRRLDTHKVSLAQAARKLAEPKKHRVAGHCHGQAYDQGIRLRGKQLKTRDR